MRAVGGGWFLVVAVVAGCGGSSGGDDAGLDPGPSTGGATSSIGGRGTGGTGATAAGVASQLGGAPSAAGASATGGGPAGGTQSGCRSSGADCFDAPATCCPGTQCVRDDEQPGVGVCTPECVTDADCSGGCCIDFGLTRVCAPFGPLCGPACVPAGQSCLANPCCEGAVCIHTTQDGSYCAAECSTDADCPTSCCGGLQGGPETVCLPASFCA